MKCCRHWRTRENRRSLHSKTHSTASSIKSTNTKTRSICYSMNSSNLKMKMFWIRSKFCRSLKKTDHFSRNWSKAREQTTCCRTWCTLWRLRRTICRRSMIKPLISCSRCRVWSGIPLSLMPMDSHHLRREWATWSIVANLTAKYIHRRRWKIWWKKGNILWEIFIQLYI